MASHTEENYLKCLFTLASVNGEVSISDLSKHLNVSTPTANSMVKKLHAKNLVLYEKYQPLTLTQEGEKQAALVVRKHRLTEMFLVETMRLGWEEVHEIAEQIEHIKSSTFFNRMDEMLGFPKVDPHGSPIPDRNGNVAWQAFDTLSECKQGDVVKLSALLHSSSDFLSFLNTKAIGLGARLTVEYVEAFDQSMTVRIGTETHVFSQAVCDRLLVEKVTPSSSLA